MEKEGASDTSLYVDEIQPRAQVLSYIHVRTHACNVDVHTLLQRVQTRLCAIYPVHRTRCMHADWLQPSHKSLSSVAKLGGPLTYHAD